MWVQLGVIASLLVVHLSSRAGAFTACDCRKSIKTETYSLFMSEPCKEKKDYVETPSHAAFVKKSESVKVEGFICSGEVLT